MRIAIIGTGYVGLTTAAALAYLGHDVVGVDNNAAKIRQLQNGVPTIHETGLERVFSSMRDRLSFSADTVQAVGTADVIMIAVGTPPAADGEADMSYVEQAASDVATGLSPDRAYTVVVKSTVPVGSNARVRGIIRQILTAANNSAVVHLASNPEFLREGMALADTLYPERIVVGVEDDHAADTLRRMYSPILDQSFESPLGVSRPVGYNEPVFLRTDPASAEMIKYASNAFLATKISFINEIAGLCERVGADVLEVSRGMGADSRIGAKFLAPGLGWGGSCFPKDTAALVAIAEERGYAMPLVQAARSVNEGQRVAVVTKLESTLHGLMGRTVTVLGLAFKPNTDDLRESPAIEVIKLLRLRGAKVKVHDPIAMPNAAEVLRDLSVEFADDPYGAAKGSDALVVATEWSHYKEINWLNLAQVMKTTVLMDARNCCDRASAQAAGFTYLGVGR